MIQAVGAEQLGGSGVRQYEMSGENKLAIAVLLPHYFCSFLTRQIL
jgi:hypothetical protein